MRKLMLSMLIAVGAVMFTAAPVRAQGSFAKAKELYSSANYDEALAILNTLTSSASEEGADAQSEDAAAASMYRVLCLVALGRSSEVDAAIERLVSHYPLYRPPSDELSPRMRTAFGSARLRLLPTMVQKRYSDSKAAYDRGEFATAGAGFKWVLGALSDPDISYVAGQPPLADIRTLATGFADLSEKAQKTVAPVPAPPVAVVSTPPPPAASPVPSPATTAAAAGAAVIVPTRDVARIYTLDDANVVAPVALRQAMPRFPGLISAPMSGVLEVVVDSNGAVESARILQPVQMQYDAMLLSAAKKWQYEPARLDGAPVRYVKRIQVNLSPSTEPLAQSGRRK